MLCNCITVLLQDMETENLIPYFITYSLCHTIEITWSQWWCLYWTWAAWSQQCHKLIYSGDLVPGTYLVLVSDQNEDWLKVPPSLVNGKSVPSKNNSGLSCMHDTSPVMSLQRQPRHMKMVRYAAGGICCHCTLSAFGCTLQCRRY